MLDKKTEYQNYTAFSINFSIRFSECHYCKNHTLKKDVNTKTHQQTKKKMVDFGNKINENYSICYYNHK